MRELSEIEQELDDDIVEVFDSPSVSQVAEWRLWRGIWSRAVYSFELILDAFKSEVETLIESKQPGSISWYYDQVMKFQGADDGDGFMGDNLVVNSYGILEYEKEDSTRCIINQCSLSESDGTLVIKVAKLDSDGLLTSLTYAELLAFSIYINNIKYPGTELNVVTLPADLIYYDINIYYDPIFSTDTITANVLAQLETYKGSLGFDDRVFKQKLGDTILNAEGVVTVKINSLMSKASTDDDFSDIDVVYQLASGYYNYDGDTPSTLNLINVNDI